MLKLQGFVMEKNMKPHYIIQKLFPFLKHPITWPIVFKSNRFAKNYHQLKSLLKKSQINSLFLLGFSWHVLSCCSSKTTEGISKEGILKISLAVDIPWNHINKSIIKVEQIWDNNDIAKNWTFP